MTSVVATPQKKKFAGWFHLLINPPRQPQTACCFFYMFSGLLTKCDFLSALSPILLMSISFIHTLVITCCFKFVLYLRYNYILTFQAI